LGLAYFRITILVSKDKKKAGREKGKQRYLRQLSDTTLKEGFANSQQRVKPERE